MVVILSRYQTFMHVYSATKPNQLLAIIPFIDSTRCLRWLRICPSLTNSRKCSPSFKTSSVKRTPFTFNFNIFYTTSSTGGRASRTRTSKPVRYLSAYDTLMYVYIETARQFRSVIFQAMLYTSRIHATHFATDSKLINKTAYESLMRSV